MKSWIASVTSTAFVAQMMLGSVAFAATPGGPTLAEPVINEATAQQAGGALNAKPDAGGLTPCLLTCYLGPRTGLEYNEGRGVATMEWIALVIGLARIIPALQAYQGMSMTQWAKENAMDSRPIPSPKGNVESKGGISACLIACYLGPRPAMERNEGRKLRSKEVLAIFLPIIFVPLIALEAYNGKTMTQIAQDEGLDG